MIQDAGRFGTRDLGGRATWPAQVLAKVDKVGTILREGMRQQQKHAKALLVDHPCVNLEGGIERVEPNEWAQPFFYDVAALVGDHGLPPISYTCTESTAGVDYKR